MIKRFVGVNIAVKDLDSAVKKYAAVFGVKPIPFKAEDFVFPGLKGASILLGNVMINLLSSDRPDTSIAKFLETKGEGIFLLSLQVTDVAQDMKEATDKGVKFVSAEPITFSNGTVNFSHPKSMNGVQFEFLQPTPSFLKRFKLE